MILHFISLFNSFLSSDLMPEFIFPILGIGFVTFVPHLLKYILHRG